MSYSKLKGKEFDLVGGGVDDSVDVIMCAKAVDTTGLPEGQIYYLKLIQVDIDGIMSFGVCIPEWDLKKLRIEYFRTDTEAIHYIRRYLIAEQGAIVRDVDYKVEGYWPFGYKLMKKPNKKE